MVRALAWVVAGFAIAIIGVALLLPTVGLNELLPMLVVVGLGMLLMFGTALRRRALPDEEHQRLQRAGAPAPDADAATSTPPTATDEDH